MFYTCDYPENTKKNSEVVKMETYDRDSDNSPSFRKNKVRHLFKLKQKKQCVNNIYVWFFQGISKGLLSIFKQFESSHLTSITLKFSTKIDIYFAPKNKTLELKLECFHFFKSKQISFSTRYQFNNFLFGSLNLFSATLLSFDARSG